MSDDEKVVRTLDANPILLQAAAERRAAAAAAAAAAEPGSAKPPSEDGSSDSDGGPDHVPGVDEEQAAEIRRIQIQKDIKNEGMAAMGYYGVEMDPMAEHDFDDVMVVIGKKHRTYQATYVLSTLAMVALLAALPNTTLWEPENISWLAVSCLVSAVCYFALQGSDPGFLTKPEGVAEDRSANDTQWNIEMSGRAVVRSEDNEYGRRAQGLEAAPDEAADEAADDGDGDGDAALLSDVDLQLVAADGTPALDWGAWPPMRASYCKPAQRHVATYDHFCPFLNTVIGERNRCRFWLFLVAQTASVALALQIAMNALLWDGNDAFRAGFAACLLGLMLCCVGSLCGFHTFLACTNMTTYEFLRSERVSYLRDTEDCDFPFSNGPVHNLRFFCGRDDLVQKLRRAAGLDAAAAADADDADADAEWRPATQKRPRVIVRDSEDWQNNLWQNKYWSCC